MRHLFYRYFTALAAAICLIACEKADPEKVSNLNTTPHMDVSLSYVGGKLVNIRNGTEYRSFYLSGGESGCLRFSITNVSGSIEIKIYRADTPDKLEYEITDIQSSDFVVDLHEEGEYIVWITARSFAGKYSIDWQPLAISFDQS